MQQDLLAHLEVDQRPNVWRQGGPRPLQQQGSELGQAAKHWRQLCCAAVGNLGRPETAMLVKPRQAEAAQPRQAAQGCLPVLRRLQLRVFVELQLPQGGPAARQPAQGAVLRVQRARLADARVHLQDAGAGSSGVGSQRHDASPRCC